ncbi:unnamed protein product [Linum tenue]|uniref:BRX domain-containing protein n=1 Tax=Linum tenue TaxID=586396 RepID=A0AAV0PQ50_9ROSI|nr:unnamed protein product [Linum tenue]
MFNKSQAQRWWAENYEKVMGLYNVQRFDQEAVPLPTPPRPEDEDEPGVYITIRALTDGNRELRRIRFSREMFGEMQTRVWWEENKARIQEQYL